MHEIGVWYAIRRFSFIFSTLNRKNEYWEQNFRRSQKVEFDETS